MLLSIDEVSNFTELTNIWCLSSATFCEPSTSKHIYCSSKKNCIISAAQGSYY